MSRLSQFFWAVNRKEFPDADTRQTRYTDLEFTPEVMNLIKAIRKQRKKAAKNLPQLLQQLISFRPGHLNIF